MLEVEALVVDELSVVNADVPVELTEPRLAVAELVVPKFPVNALLVEALVVDAFNVLKFPVVPKIVVNSPVTNDRNDPLTPVEVVVADTERLVEVELVIVPLATLIDGRDKLVTDKLVIVAEVIVAFVPFRFVVLVVIELEVDAFVVLEFKVVILAVPVAVTFVKFPF